jgi:3-oxoacyl-[acyl-carrier-protein] synthase III
MRNKSNSRITGLGTYLPDRILTNQDLEKMVDTNDEWIVRRTGVRERRLSDKEEFASDMAIKAVKNLIEKNNISVEDVDMIIVTTFTPDHLIPTVSSLVQGYFGMEGAGTMDLSAACTGFTYGLCVADALITAGHNNKILVISSETVSKVVDYTDRNTCILFGDAAVVVLVERTEGKGSIIASYFTSDGNLAEKITCGNFSDKVNGKVLGEKMFFQQDGKFIYEYIIKNVPEGVLKLLNKAEMKLEDIAWFVPHSANLRMIEAVCKKLAFPLDKTLLSNEFYGNTSSASIPLAVWMALEETKIKSGDKIILYGFGGGLTHGGIVMEW